MLPGTHWSLANLNGPGADGLLDLLLRVGQRLLLAHDDGDRGAGLAERLRAPCRRASFRTMRKVLSSTASSCRRTSTGAGRRCRARPSACSEAITSLVVTGAAVVELQAVAQRERVGTCPSLTSYLSTICGWARGSRRCRTACRRPACRGCRRWSASSRTDRGCARRRASRRAVTFCAPAGGRRAPRGRGERRRRAPRPDRMQSVPRAKAHGVVLPMPEDACAAVCRRSRAGAQYAAAAAPVPRMAQKIRPGDVSSSSGQIGRCTRV